jgi:hypothetical protein
MPASTASSKGPTSALDDELRATTAFKKVGLMVLGTAMQTYGEKLTEQQELLGYAADILMDTFAAESAVLRARQALASRHPQDGLHEAAAAVFVNDAAQRVEMAARSALAAMAEGDTLRTLLAALRRLLKVVPVNTVALRRTLADAAVANGGYMLNA